MRITIASVSTDSRAQNYYKTKRRRKSRVRGKTAKRRLIFSKDMRVRARAGYVRGRRAGRAYLLSMRKNEKCWKTRAESMRKNERGEYAGGARESKRNDWIESCESAGGEMVET